MSYYIPKGVIYPKPICYACRYSGSDEEQYRAYGCPDCICGEKYALPVPEEGLDEDLETESF